LHTFDASLERRDASPRLQEDRKVVWDLDGGPRKAISVEIRCSSIRFRPQRQRRQTAYGRLVGVFGHDVDDVRLFGSVG
jgi:hypothetical protein